MASERRRRLIEVAFPLEEVSAPSRREKNVRHGRISTLHICGDRLRLAACRNIQARFIGKVRLNS